MISPYTALTVILKPKTLKSLLGCPNAHLQLKDQEYYKTPLPFSLTALLADPLHQETAKVLPGSLFMNRFSWFMPREKHELCLSITNFSEGPVPTQK